MDAVWKVTAPFCKLGIPDEVLKQAAAAEAAGLTENLLRDAEQYAIRRAINVRVSAERLMKRFAAMAGVATGATSIKKSRWGNNQAKSK